jgi:hypothetical protein
MELVVCGTRVEIWTLEYLKENIVPLHGYSAGSQSFLNFLEVLSEFTEEQKREFLMFAIGAPRLPLGGLKKPLPKTYSCKEAPSQRKTKCRFYSPFSHDLSKLHKNFLTTPRRTYLRRS